MKSTSRVSATASYNSTICVSPKGMRYPPSFLARQVKMIGNSPAAAAQLAQGLDHRGRVGNRAEVVDTPLEQVG